MRKRERGENLKPEGPEDLVDEASEESFPASDPPAWEPLHVGEPAPPDGHASAAESEAASDDGE